VRADELLIVSVDVIFGGKKLARAKVELMDRGPLRIHQLIARFWAFATTVFMFDRTRLQQQPFTGDSNGHMIVAGTDDDAHAASDRGFGDATIADIEVDIDEGNLARVVARDDRQASALVLARWMT
jgi:hypothetical protein